MRDEDARVRIMVVIDSLDQGGAEQSLAAVLPLLVASGIACEVLLLRSTSPDREDALRRCGVTVRDLDCGSHPLRVARALRPLLRRERPDILHVTLFAPIIGGGLAAVGTDVPVVASVVNTPVRSSGTATGGRVLQAKRRAAQVVEIAALRTLVSTIHAVTDGVRQSYRRPLRWCGGPIEVAERGRDGQRFRPPTPDERASVRDELGIEPDDEVVVALGRHEPDKGFDVLVDAVAELSHRRPRTRLVIAGREGSATDDLRRRIKDSGLEGRAVFLGDRRDPERVLAAGDVFALSSRREGASGATLEAMATGLPIVAPLLDGLAGVIDDGVHCTFVPIGDAAALAGALERLLADRTLADRLGAAGRARFLERFTLDRSAEQLAALYQRAITRGR